ncbi:MAG: ferredoxin [Bacteroidales bacterium]|nr:ferredoxin [Bacteroidales bacterium]
MIRITHYREKCIGCYYCVDIAPTRWEIDEVDGKSLLIEASNKKGIYIAKVPDFEYDENIQAANACPVGIIKVEKI